MQKEIKYGSYTATPDDYTCPDGDLAAMAGLERDYSLRGEDKPKDLMGLPGGLKALCLHKTSAYKHYVLKGNGRLYWMTEADSGAKDAGGHVYSGDIYKVEPIGNTLVVLAEDGVHYLLWQDGGYKYLGNHLPELDLEFSLLGATTSASEEIALEDGILLTELQNKEEYYVNIVMAIQGAVNKSVWNAQSKGLAIYPFFVRYGYRLYDGSTITMQSAPILMAIPDGTVKATMRWTVNNEGKVYGITGGDGHERAKSTDARVVGYLLFYRVVDNLQKVDLENWKDIVDKVVFYVSPQFPTINLDVEEKKIKFEESAVIFPVNEKRHAQVVDNSSFHYISEFGIEQLGENVYDGEISNKEYGAGIATQVSAMNEAGFSWVKPECELRNEIVVSRPSMPDDFQSHDRLLATGCSSSYGYNGRLNLAHMSRVLFEGFPACSLWHEERLATSSSSSSGRAGWATTRETEEEVLQESAVPCRITVVVADDNGKEVVMRTHESSISFFDDTKIVWYYYPSPKGKRAYFDVNGTVYVVQLKKHPMLYGSYYYGLAETAVQPTESSLPEPSAEAERIVDMPGKLYTSEVNNPFFFPLLGVNTIGAGEILGVCAAVKAMSQGQFGEYPMYVFTTEGVWALQTKSDGTWGAVTPVTRDVCIDADSITQMDDAVLFVTHRGIMLISGSTSQCISEVIDGRVGFSLDMMTEKSNALKLLVDGTVRMNKPSTGLELSTFERFREGMRMVYDYRHQRIVVYNGTRDGSSAKVYPYAYVYSLKLHQWSIVASDLVDHINSYPDAVGVTLGNRLAVLSDESDNVSPTPFVLVTRPLKMDAPDIMKTVRCVIQRGEFVKDHVKQVLFGSRDLMHWHLVASSKDCYLRGYSGTPYKWFRLVVFGSLDEGESLTGCTIDYTTRLENQPR